MKLKPVTFAAFFLALFTAACSADFVPQDRQAIAAIKLTGISDVVLKGPTFRCGLRGTEPNAQGNSDVWRNDQRGFFFQGINVQGLGVYGAVCVGSAQPARVKITRTYPAPVYEPVRPEDSARHRHYH